MISYTKLVKPERKKATTIRELMRWCFRAVNLVLLPQVDTLFNSIHLCRSSITVHYSQKQREAATKIVSCRKMKLHMPSWRFVQLAFGIVRDKASR